MLYMEQFLALSWPEEEDFASETCLTVMFGLDGLNGAFAQTLLLRGSSSSVRLFSQSLLNSAGEELAGFDKPGETTLHKGNRWPTRSEYAAH